MVVWQERDRLITDEFLSAIFFVMVIFSLVTNGIFIVVILLRRRLWRGHYGLLLSISVVDVTMMSLWAVFSGAVINPTFQWNIPSEVCHFQSFLLTIGQTLTSLTLASLALERLLKVLNPYRHSIIFIPAITLVLIVGVWGFSAIFSSIHLYGMLPVLWMSELRTCAADFSFNVRFLDYHFAIYYAIPYLVIALPAFAVCFVKIFIARKQSPTTGEIVLQRNKNAPGDSYSARLSKIQSKFSSRHSKLKSGKLPTLGLREFTLQGYSDPEMWDTEEENEEEASSNGKPIKKGLYLLPRTEYMMLRGAAITTCVSCLLWLPWQVANFCWNYDPLEDMPEFLPIAAIFFILLSCALRPVVYTLSNPYFRKAVVTTLCRPGKY